MISLLMNKIVFHHQIELVRKSFLVKFLIKIKNKIIRKSKMVISL